MGRGWVLSIQVASVYVGTVVGAGFATGREIVEFFTQYGLFGIAGISIAGLLFILLGTKMMILSKRIDANSYQELNIFLFGRFIGRFVNLLMLFVLLGITSVMLSGAGAIFEEQLGLSKQLGMILTIILTTFVMLYGIKGLFRVNVVVVPMLILFSVMIAAQSLHIHEFQLIVIENPRTVQWIVSALSYAAFNLTLAAAVLVPLAKEVKDEVVLIRGGVLGGALLTLILLTSHISLSTLPNVASYDVPMAEVMKTTFFAFYFIYIAVIYGEVFTSVIGNLFGLERQLLQYVNVRRMVMITLILFISVIISQVGYSSLLTLLYPLFGKIALVVLVLMIIKKVPKEFS